MSSLACRGRETLACLFMLGAAYSSHVQLTTSCTKGTPDLGAAKRHTSTTPATQTQHETVKLLLLLSNNSLNNRHVKPAALEHLQTYQRTTC
ncbi:hypothetical protein COO60DRAFT_1480231 [Scenedesmus sp. NREL 46B-D3]|nr:hypothetical protein COO60DRAFT_1480231 [Scenedesmus sp. NREL 46B-D3]